MQSEPTLRNPRAPEITGECSDGNRRYPRLRSSVMRKRVMAVFGVVLVDALIIICFFYQAKLVESRSFRIWWFWSGTVFVNVWLILAIVHALGKKLRP